MAPEEVGRPSDYGSAVVIDDAKVVVAGNIFIEAAAKSTITAIADSSVSSSGGSAYGTGVSLAVNGTIATNQITC